VTGVFDLSGKVALVTGAGQNVGAGIAHALARQGAAVAVNDLVGERAEATVSAVRAAGGRAEAAVFDITDVDAVGVGVEAVAAALGPVDILVNNAGVPAGMRPVQFRQLPREEWDRYIDLNVYGSLNCVAAVIDGMCARGWGRVVQISSGAGRTGLRLGVALYGASKSGDEGFIRHLAIEVARDGVTANAIALGLMDNGSGEATASLARQVPAGRLGAPADVGAAVVYVASPEASWLTGQTIDLNGGQTMH
jgi:NAD(P)-dependent dehydrogenase (short-subunit alcohol dehydrogenase family)